MAIAGEGARGLGAAAGVIAEIELVGIEVVGGAHDQLDVLLPHAERHAELVARERAADAAQRDTRTDAGSDLAEPRPRASSPECPRRGCGPV
mgnify:CR=1 FL=1